MIELLIQEMFKQHGLKLSKQGASDEWRSGTGLWVLYRKRTDSYRISITRKTVIKKVKHLFIEEFGAPDGNTHRGSRDDYEQPFWNLSMKDSLKAAELFQKAHQ